ncbi:CHASE domain-containing protein [Tabrizicola sp.]|uniref:CHASE domain-containing protein n=1 Tax=Tabrizicola sp. TaxID=2005166 RepID=UPI00273394AC|nr:CHASE domain-containing protein [Tabrizicola sp.]MDP3197412.1 CHASE domain-containing protein [Tabrizicola sp.]
MRQFLAAQLPKLVFLLAFLPGLAVTVAVYTGAERRIEAEFVRVADLAIDRVVSRLQQHVVVLRAARGLLSATRGGIVRDEFLRFLSSVDIVTELSGVQGIGFARMIATTDTALAEDEVRTHYGLDIDVHPQTDQSWRTPIVLLEPQNPRNSAALGYDMFSEPVRRLAMNLAILTGEARMTAPVQLVQEITSDKQTGFLVYLPFQSTAQPAGSQSRPVEGFVYAPFRGGDLIRAALSVGAPLPVALRIVDVEAPGTPLFDDSSDAAARPLHHNRSLDILGRQWRFDVWSDKANIGQVRHLSSVLLGLTSFLFAAAAAYAVVARQKEALQARAVAAAAAREAEYRELLLQEMKHRIKNHIARIQSISRQSARGATDVKAFTTAFDARLQAMSAVQEILAGSAVAQADVRAVLVKELQQSLDATEVQHLIDGPPVRLDERQAHAFALVVHELVTNAMKYGGLSVGGQGLEIRWSVQTEAGGSPRIQLHWTERISGLSAPPETGSGFGSRLIEASLKGELQGSLTRDYGPEGLQIRISFPLDPALNRTST